MKFVALALLCIPAALSAQDPSGTWRTLHSQHFRIHFRPEHRTLATQAAAEAERAYALLAGELHAPRGIVDMMLADDVDAANGFASTYPSNRITILLVPPVTDPGLRDYDSWQRLVIVHELTHVFHLDRTRRWWRVLQSVFGRLPGTFPNQYQPSWVTEGLATYYESRFTGAGRAGGGFHHQIVAADRLHGSARSPWDALYFTRWPGGFAPYAYGSRFWEFLSTRGDTVVPRFVEKSAGQLIPFRVGRPLRLAGADLQRAWRDAVVSTTLGSSPPGVSRPLIAGRLQSQPVPRVAPDGKHVAYLHDDGRGARRLRVIDPVSGLVLRSHRVTGQVSYDWAGDTLLVAQLEFTGRWQLRSDLWSWTPPPELAWRRLTTAGRFIEPRTGGGVVAAIELMPGDNAPAALGSMAPLPDGAGTTWGAAVPSADGQSIVASRHREGRWELVRWRAGSGAAGVEVLASPPGGVSDPSWASGGRDVLFVSDIAGLPQVLRWSEGEIVQLTSEAAGARAPAALADGTILFTTLGRGGWELRSVAPRALTTSSAQRAVAGPPAAFDSAPPVPVRETGYAEWPSLRPHFWVPLVFNAGEAGFFVGAATAGVDAVGKHSYFAQALVAPSPLRAQGAFALVSHALGDPTLDFYVANDWSVAGIDTAGRDHLFSSNHVEASAGATVLSLRWFGFVSLRLALDYEGRWYRVSPDTVVTDLCPGCAHRDRVGATASLAFGSAVGAPLTVSLQDGFTATFLYKRREEQGSSRWLNEVRGRLAVYGRFGPRIGFGYPVLALRVAAGAFDGPIVERLSVGGVSSGAMALPFGQALGAQRSFPVRGYRAGTLRGRRAATATAEYRVPLALIGRSLGHLPFGADKFAVTLFGDMGDAWNPGEDPRFHRLRSAGVELVGDLTVSYDLPLRVRSGMAWPHGRGPAGYVGFAADF
jgi:hypothetical protein